MDTKRIIGGAAIVVAVVIAIALVVGGAERQESVEPGSFDPGEIGETPLVITRREAGGFELFGIQITAPDRWLTVGVAPRPECIVSDDRGNDVLSDSPPCDEYASLAGPVLGGGTTQQGIRWVEVRVDVDRACLDATTVGDPWPTSNPACG